MDALNVRYAELKRAVTAAGLLERQPRYYACKIVATLGLLAAAIALLAVSRNPCLVLLDAAVFGLAYGQIGLLGHDTCHNGVFASPRANAVLSAILANLLMGMSYRWWTTEHNRHHGTSNRLGVDEEMEYPFFVMDEQQIPLKARTGVSGSVLFIMEHQHLLAWPILMLVGLNLRLRSHAFLRRRRGEGRTVELALLLAHWLWYLPLVVLSQGPVIGLLFVIAHQALFGFYVGLITATNHWGMPLVADPPPVEFLRLQIVTSRNVTGGPAVDLLFGGLNRQIEHHLFPSMPRNNLSKARPLVQELCRREGIPYRETSLRTTLADMFRALRRIALVVRAERTTLAARCAA